MPYHKGKLLYAKAAYAASQKHCVQRCLSSLIVFVNFSLSLSVSLSLSPFHIYLSVYLSMLSTVDSIVWGALWMNRHTHTCATFDAFTYTLSDVHTATCFGIFVQYTHSNFISNLPVQFSSVLGKWMNALLCEHFVVIFQFGCCCGVLSTYTAYIFFFSEGFFPTCVLFTSYTHILLSFSSVVPIECVLCVYVVVVCFSCVAFNF